MTAQPDIDATRSKLLDAAGEVFAESGFHAATVRDICARAEANVAAVNYHFRDKLGLYSEVLKQSMRDTQGEIVDDAVAHAKTPEEALRRIVSGMLQRMCNGGRAAWSLRIMAHEMARPTPALVNVIDEVMLPRYQRLRGVIGKILGMTPDDETTRLCAHSVIGQVIHFAHARPVISVLWPALNLNKSEDTAMVADHIAEFTLRSLRSIARKKNRGEK